MFLRLAYLGVTNAFALLRLLPGSNRDKDAEMLALRHQLAVLHRQLNGQRVRFDPARPGLAGRAAQQTPRAGFAELEAAVRPDTILRWQRDLLARCHAAASRPQR